jgi:putative aminopeptidase FrvX
MLKPSAVTFLKTLLDTPGPSGYEAAAAKVWRDEAGTFAAEVHADVHGNSMAVVNPSGSPTIMLAGHIDEIGVIVTYIDDDGYVYIAPIGGWDPQVLVASASGSSGATGTCWARWERSRSIS